MAFPKGRRRIISDERWRCCPLIHSFWHDFGQPLEFRNTFPTRTAEDLSRELTTAPLVSIQSCQRLIILKHSMNCIIENHQQRHIAGADLRQHAPSLCPKESWQIKTVSDALIFTRDRNQNRVSSMITPFQCLWAIYPVGFR